MCHPPPGTILPSLTADLEIVAAFFGSGSSASGAADLIGESPLSRLPTKESPYQIG
ncbi:hypothetical protein PILCRDRAFT_822571 [Piloderma croceum F 1598]|uniref:Uncharacterized protein n=1 Tax=Piloderma croceum (strain F 1598) TaxID=765440 RepID=A0A0C3B2M5_PILCF|nr:hypothetical protein PILCRDRAFT_822571 [Piloderma croceum F 1598]